MIGYTWDCDGRLVFINPPAEADGIQSGVFGHHHRVVFAEQGGQLIEVDEAGWALRGAKGVTGLDSIQVGLAMEECPRENIN